MLTSKIVMQCSLAVQILSELHASQTLLETDYQIIQLHQDRYAVFTMMENLAHAHLLHCMVVALQLPNCFALG